MLVQKFNGSLQELDVNKINKWVSYASRDAKCIEWPAIVDEAHLKLYDGMPTSQITLALCDACEVLANRSANDEKDYISAKEYLDAGQELYIPYMLKVAFNTKKSLFGDTEPLGKVLTLSDETTLEYRNYSLYQTVQLGMSLGKYDSSFSILSEELINKCEDLIDYSMMYNHPLCGLKQLASKYVIKHKKVPFENPQEAFMLIAIALALSDSSNGGNTVDSIPYCTKWFLDTVHYYYHYVSNGLTNLPTPSMAGIRSSLKQFASCTLFAVGDNLPSISQAYDIASKATAARAGLGISLGSIRALGSMIRGGEVTHTGLIPFLKVLSGISKSCTQNGVRGGGGTVNLPIWHRDFFDLVMLKDISGIEGENRLRQLDYAFHYNIDQLIQLMEDGNLLLMSPHTQFNGKTIYDWFYDVDENGMYDPSTFNEYCKLRLADKTLKHYKDPSLANGEECYVSAYDVFDALSTQMIQTSRMYTFIVDNVNNHSAFLQRVEMTNLCVGEGTPVLTKNGVIPIELLENQDVEIWNGTQWSIAHFAKTNENAKLIKVTFSNGAEIFTTEYHRWPILNSDYAKRNNKFEIKTTANLKIGDVVSKFDTNFVLQFDKELNKAYTNGFYSGDGFWHTAKNRADAFVYGPKLCVISRLDYDTISEHSLEYDRTLVTFSGLESKFFVPIGYSVTSKLNWLAGILDSDGTVLNNAGYCSLQISSIENSFLNDIRLMLLELGIHSTVSLYREAGFVKFKKDIKSYPTQDIYRLLISSLHVNKLIELGLHTERLKLFVSSVLNNTNRYVAVSNVEDLNISGPTWCCNEPINNMFIANGVLSMNCVEILQPVFAYDDTRRWIKPEVSLCTLGGIPWGKIKLEDMPSVCMAQLRILNSKLHIMKGSVIPYTDDSMRRMNVGIGAIDVFHMLAKEVFSKFPKDQWVQESARVTHLWMEHMQFYLLKAAVELAKQYGPCEWFHKTKYSKGILPIDTYTKSKYVDFPLTCDWEGLRKDIIEHGMRFSLVTAHMPSESSSVVWGFLNSSEPPKAAVIVKGSKSSQVTMMCPDLHLYGGIYPYVWDDHPFDINDLYFSIAVNLAKFSDQGISYNTYINYQKTPRLDQKYLFRILFARPALCGIKTTYYVNNNVDSDSSDLVKKPVEVEDALEQTNEDDGGCAGGFCTL